MVGTDLESVYLNIALIYSVKEKKAKASTLLKKSFQKRFL